MSERKLARIHVNLAIPEITVMTTLVMDMVSTLVIDSVSTLVIDLVSRAIIIVVHVTVVSPYFDLRKLGIEINGSLMPSKWRRLLWPNVG